MADTAPKQTAFVAFDKSVQQEERLAAVLVTKTEDGTIKAYVKDVPGRNAPPADAVDWFKQAVELANL
jgi:hypothetical protein